MNEQKGLVSPKILIVDDEEAIRESLSTALDLYGYKSYTASSVKEARKIISELGHVDIILSDILMPGESGLDLLNEIAPLAPETIIVMATSVSDVNIGINALKNGAYDYILKPFDLENVRMLLARALNRARLEKENINYQNNLEIIAEERAKKLAGYTLSLKRTRIALLRGLCRMAEYRDSETGHHIDRVASYAKLIASELKRDSKYSPFISNEWINDLFEGSPLHDIGKVGISDAILLKPGSLTTDEFSMMKKHATIGKDILFTIGKHLDENEAFFLKVAMEVAECHHERWDGNGYPSGKKEEDIPLSARITTISDYYDACRMPRIYRPVPYSHEEVIRNMLEKSGTLFDPEILRTFLRVEKEVIKIHKELSDVFPDYPEPR